MKISNLLLIAFGISLFISCSNEVENEVENDVKNEVDNKKNTANGDYSNGFFILNEGGAGQGTVSFSSNDFGVFTKDAYTAENGSDLLGKNATSIFFNGDNAYIIAGASDVITVVNRYTFKLIAKIDTGLKQPRYGVVKDGKAYVINSNKYVGWGGAWDNDDTDDYIAVIDLATNKYESKIDLNASADRIIEKDGKLYMTEFINNNDNLNLLLFVVDIATKSLETPIVITSEAYTDALSMEEKDGIIYILTNNYFQKSKSKIVKVKVSDNTISRITFPEALGEASFMDIYDDKIYYTVKNSVYAINTNVTQATTTPIVTAPTEAFYGFAVNNNRIYLADGGDYKLDSKAYVYNLTGTLQKELTVGVRPNGFYFNN